MIELDNPKDPSIAIDAPIVVKVKCNPFSSAPKKRAIIIPSNN